LYYYYYYYHAVRTETHIFVIGHNAMIQIDRMVAFFFKSRSI